MSVGQRSGDAKRRRVGKRSGVALGLQKAAQALDKVRRPLGEIGNRAVTNLAIEAIGFAQKDAGRRVAIADTFDKHGYFFVGRIARKALE